MGKMMKTSRRNCYAYVITKEEEETDRLHKMHQRQPIIIDFFFESLNGDLRVFLIHFRSMSIVNFINHFITYRLMSIIYM